MYSQDLFEEMIRDWKADNAPEYEDLIITQICQENGAWIAIAEDATTRYTLTDTDGTIIINYLDTK